MFPVDEYLFRSLEKRKEKNALRVLSSENNSLTDFSSNDYLGLSRSNQLHQNIVKELSGLKISNGSTGSRLLTGNSIYTEQLESMVARFHQCKSALLFNSGYTANIGLFASVPQKNDVILYDEYVHASIRDGIRLSWAKSYSFKHDSITDLKNKLEKSNTDGNIFVAVESVYSMDGDFAPLKELIDVCKHYSAHLIVDEAHASGVYGEKGEGRCVMENIHEDCFARIYTFGKALGVHGAVVTGSKLLTDYLINYSRSFIYTTALPLHALASIKCVYQLLPNLIQERSHLEYLIKYFYEKASGLNLLNSKSPIQGIIISGNDKAKNVAKKLQLKGFDVRPILSPTVPEKKERLRINLHSFNTTKEIDNLIINLEHCVDNESV